jgi:hypothetical protein
VGLFRDCFQWRWIACHPHQGLAVFRRQALILLLSLLVWYPFAAAAYEVSREDKIKAAIIYKLTKFVRWPATALPHDSNPLVMCALGSDPVGEALSNVEGRTVWNRKARFLQISASQEAVDHCHVVFIPRSQAPHMERILQELRDRPVLTVSDAPRFAQLGGMVGLVKLTNRISFEINLEATRRARISISAQLLELAHIVGDES